LARCCANTQPANYSVETAHLGSIFNINIAVDTAVSLMLIRTNATSGFIDTEVFAAEEANQLNWHNPEVSMGEQINFQSVAKIYGIRTNAHQDLIMNWISLFYYCRQNLERYC
jgi:hypothetical protein